jgi:hypothetical protein
MSYPRNWEDDTVDADETLLAIEAYTYRFLAYLFLPQVAQGFT